MAIYEGMFLVNSSLLADWAAAEPEVKRVLDRAEAKILALRRWDERRLAYEIEGQKRGLYALAYFECAGDKIEQIERDVRLGDRILRVLILRAEGMTMEKIESIFTRGPVWKGTSERSGEGDEGGDDRRPRRRDHGGEPAGMGGRPELTPVPAS